MTLRASNSDEMDLRGGIVFILVCMFGCSAKFTDPYLAEDFDGGDVEVEPFTNHLGSPIVLSTIAVFGLSDWNECDYYDFSIHSTDGSLKLGLQIYNRFTITDDGSPLCEVYWGDTKHSEVELVESKMLVEHTYNKFGVYQIFLECTYQTITERCPYSFSDCLQTSDVLDDAFRSINTPLTYFTHKPILVKSYVQIAKATCSLSRIEWRVTKLQDGKLGKEVNILQYDTSVLRIDVGTLDAGGYLVCLNVSFPDVSPKHWSSDFIIMKIVHPELISHINGGEELRVPHDRDVFIDASQSHDPAERISLDELRISWSLIYYIKKETSSSAFQQALNNFIVNYPDFPLPHGGTTRQIRNGTDKALHVKPSSIPVYSTVIVIFKMSRDTRMSSAMQVLHINEHTLPIGLQCVYNCHIGRERLFYFDRIHVDIVFPPEMNTTDLEYTWDISTWNETVGFISELASVTLQTGKNGPALGVTSYPIQGMTYKLTVIVRSPYGTIGTASLIRTVNYLPYDGSCTLDSSSVRPSGVRSEYVGLQLIISVVSARDWVTLSCTSWRGNDDRMTQDSALDVNPMLTYTVVQRTEGAVVYEETILQTRSQRSHVILKVGDPASMYNTELYVRVTDIFNDYTQLDISVTSLSAFNTSSVTPTETGAQIVSDYIKLDYIYNEKQLRDLGKDDMIISLVSAVCSNIHLVQLPVWTPPVPRVLNTNGSIVDLNVDGNIDIGTLDEALSAVTNNTEDPATLTIQEVMLNLTQTIVDVVDDAIIRGNGTDDTTLSSLITNAFTNLVSRDQFISTEAKISIVDIGQIVGIDALKATSSTVDQPAQIETTAGEIYRMFQEIVQSVVPDDLTQNRPVNDLLAADTQIGDMLTVMNQNISIYDTKLSPIERAYIYRKMQLFLRYYTDERKAVSRKAAKSSVVLAREIQSVLKLCSKCNNRDSNSTQQLVHKNTGTNVTGDVIETKSRASQFRIDGLNKALENSSLDEMGTVVVSAFEFDENVYMYDDDGTSSFVTSKILRVDVKSDDQQIYPDEMTFDQFVQTPDATRVIPEVSDEDASEFMYHTFIYQKNTDYLCLMVKPVNEISRNVNENGNTKFGSSNISTYEIYISFKTSPSTLEYDFIFTVSEDDDWMNCVPPSMMNGHTGITYMGISLPGDMKLIDYNLTIVTVGCLTWNERLTKWQTDKCWLDWIPQNDKLSCYCYDVSDMVFANSFYVAPNSIDFSSVFLKFSPLSQAAVMGTLITMYVIYVIGVIVLRRYDKGDKLKWGMTPLCDNIVTDNQFYLIKVYTGLRRGAGTKSSIAFNLKGTLGETGPRSLSDGIRPGFSRGSCMTFFMATHAWLGPLQYLSIWHDRDNEDDYSSWYINQVIVYDVSKEQTYTFVVEQWLSVETSVYINIRSYAGSEPLSFESRFFYRTRDRLAEGHMWASMFYRPQSSVFTRVQRLSCVLVYILLNMIANAMYFDPDPNYESPPLLQAGPFLFTSKQAYVSIISALITTPPIMVLVLLFNRTQAETCRKLHCSSSEKHHCCRRSSSHNYKYTSHDVPNQSLQHSRLMSTLLTNHSLELHGKFNLPHRFIYIIWCIILASVVVPSFFIVLFSIEWGKQKSEEWLTSFFLSLIESATVVDPIMVVCVAFLLAIVKRVQVEAAKIDVVDVVRKYRKLIVSTFDRPKFVSPPLEEDCLDNVRRQKRHQSDLTSSFRDITMAILFMLLVCGIAYSNRDDRSYLCHAGITNTIVEPLKLPQFGLIKAPGDLYTWLNVTALPALFPELDYNGRTLDWTERDFMTGQNNIRVGPPRLRQLRMRKDKCNIPYIGSVECNHKYSMTNEAVDNFCIGWYKRPCSIEDKVFSETSDAWKFTHALDIWGLPLSGLHTTYGGGGYIALFAVSRSNTFTILDELFQNIWINRQTRAVLFEFTLYNPATNLFIYNEFLVEFLETGGALTSYNIYPMRLYNHHGGIGNFTLICEIFFVIYLIVFIVKIVIRLYQQRLQYFKTFWQVYELLMLIISFAAFVAYFIRLGLTSSTISKFKKDKRQFVNFAHVVLSDQIYSALLGTLVFMATIRILQTFSASKRVSAVVKIFQDCGMDLFWFSTCFVYILIGFCLLGLFLFGSYLQSYMNMYHSLATLFLVIIGKSKFTEIEETQPVLAKIFFSIYVVTIVFYIMTIFISILGASIDTVVHDTRVDKEEDLLEYMAKPLKLLIKKHGRNYGLMRKYSTSFTRIERISIICTADSSRGITPTPSKEETCFPTEPAVPVLRPHAFSRFKTTTLQKKIAKGQYVFISE